MGLALPFLAVGVVAFVIAGAVMAGIVVWRYNYAWCEQCGESISRTQAQAQADASS